MGVGTHTASVDAPQESFWGKTKRAVKEFFEGAVMAAPKALLFTAGAFAVSATLGHMTGGAFNPMQVNELNGELVGRFLTVSLISSSISGVINSYTVLNRSDETPKNEAPAGNNKAAGAGKTQEMSYGDMSPPQVPREARVSGVTK